MKRTILFLVILFLMTSCSDAQRGNFFMWQMALIPVACDPLAIGCYYQGGQIAYIYQSGDPGYVSGEVHGIIVSSADIENESWYNGTFTTTGATATALGTGAVNTTTIVANQGTGANGAYDCLNYANGGYSDWYMPSKDELHKIYLAKVAIGGVWTNNYLYSSSSEYDDRNCWFEDFRYGNQWYSQGDVYDSKAYHMSIRAIRYF